MPTVLEQIRKLEEQKASLLEQAKQEAMNKALAAIEELKELGFNYSLAERSGSSTTFTTPARSGTRRTGIRDEVLRVIQQGDGMARADILKELNAEDKSSQQSISNALAALKKQGIITATNGVYSAAA